MNLACVFGSLSDIVDAFLAIFRKVVKLYYAKVSINRIVKAVSKVLIYFFVA